jgi:hypothetical protein
MRYFTPTELSAVEQAQRRAEEMTGEHFKLSAFDVDRYPYEVATLEQLDAREIDASAFAHLVRYRRHPLRRPAGRLGRLRHYYRIGLQDENLLARVAEGMPLEPTLLYVMTHELVHIVRFEHFAELFDADPERRAREEARVHALAAEVLRPLRDANLARLAALYGQGIGGCAGCPGDKLRS